MQGDLDGEVNIFGREGTGHRKLKNVYINTCPIFKAYRDGAATFLTTVLKPVIRSSSVTQRRDIIIIINSDEGQKRSVVAPIAVIKGFINYTQCRKAPQNSKWQKGDMG
jgi:hypothetical protein